MEKGIAENGGVVNDSLIKCAKVALNGNALE